MELNIALIVGFIIWCGISLALVSIYEFKVRRLRTMVAVEANNTGYYYKLWKVESEKFNSLIGHLKALTIVGKRDDIQ